MDSPSHPPSSLPPLSLEDMQQQMLQLQHQLSQLMSLIPTPPSPPSPLSKAASTTPSSILSTPLLKVAAPDTFDGTSSKAEAFISPLLLYFHGRKVKDDTDKVILALSYMKGGTAGPWAQLKVKEYTQNSVSSWNLFLEEFRQVFGDSNPSGTARYKMNQLRQGNLTADEFVARFRELKQDTLYNDAALVEKVQQGLNSSLVDRIYTLPQMPSNLEEWFAWAIKLDRQWREREANKRLFTSSSRSLAPSSRPSPPTSKP